jgi:hypothetical protein
VLGPDLLQPALSPHSGLDVSDIILTANLMDVTFCINLGGDACLSEAEIASEFHNLRATLLQTEVLEGGIIIRSSDATEVQIEDELEAAIQNVCFVSIPKLVAGEHVVVRYFSYYGYLRFDPEGDNVLISGDFVPTVRVLRAELIPALFHCGRRFVELYRRFAATDSSHEANIRHLEAQAEIAQRALHLT